jgi:hypothetical protein
MLHDPALIFYTKVCLCRNVNPDDGHGERLKHEEFLEIKAKIQLYLVGCIYTYTFLLTFQVVLKLIPKDAGNHESVVELAL